MFGEMCLLYFALDNLIVKVFYKTESNYDIRNQLQPFRAAET
jgi:hypothetical protein